MKHTLVQLGQVVVDQKSAVTTQGFYIRINLNKIVLTQ